ncbi:uncharacterized protein LTR77_002978 [Saxophila tyrrhenica]|uniref:Calponin-homology (CH) domain-containing protein n=1 Tax=Saxophila tyrrhenica TaxID=1690608 RepID=A0AAV9PHT0_9PEZI|nr:hypothetical protein LTR77_002978 [Saxophila tyrrhenica]
MGIAPDGTPPTIGGSAVTIPSTTAQERIASNTPLPNTPPSELTFGQPTKATFDQVGFGKTWASPADQGPAFSSLSATAKEASSDDFTTTLSDRNCSDDVLSRALHRAKAKRSAVFGHADKAADHVLGEYLDSTYAHDLPGCDSLRDLMQALQPVKSEAMRFMRYLFDKAATAQAANHLHATYSYLNTGRRERYQRSDMRGGQVKTEENKEASRYFGAMTARKSRIKLSPWDQPENPYETCCDHPTTPATEYRKEFLGTPFDLMGLPPELRVRIFELALAPGSVSLTSCAHQMPQSTFPVLTPALLRTSRQLKQEAEGLLEANTLIVNASLQSGTRSVIHRTEVPPALLSKIKRLVLVVDAINYNVGPPPESKVQFDWRQLQALTSLTHLRVIGLESPNSDVAVDFWELVLGEIVRRIPANCKLEYGAESPLEIAHVSRMARTIEKAPRRWAGSGPKKVDEAAVAKLKQAAARVSANVEQGVKSGQSYLAAMSRPSISTPCPAPWPSGPFQGRRLSATSVGSLDDTANIEYTRAMDLEIGRAKPRRKSTFKRKEQKAAPITIFEDVLEDEELAVEPRRAVAGSTLLARPAQKPTHRAVSRAPDVLQEKQRLQQPRAQQRTSPSQQMAATQNYVKMQSHVDRELGGAKEELGGNGRANAGLKKEPRRRTIFVPSDDTTLLTIHPGAQTTGRLDDTFQLASLHGQPPIAQERAAKPQPPTAKAFKRPRLSMAVAPKRLPLTSVPSQDLSNKLGFDVTGTNGGKENLPPGGDEAASVVTQSKKPTVVIPEKPIAHSSLFQPTAASKARQSIVPRAAVPLPRTSASICATLVPAKGRTLRPDGSAQQADKSNRDDSRAQPSQQARKAWPETKTDLKAINGRRSVNRVRPAERKVPRLAQYPVLSEDLAEPELYEDSWLSHQEIALTEVVNQILRAAGPDEDGWRQPTISLRERLIKVYHQQEVTTLYRRLQASLLYGALSRPKDAPLPPEPALDIGLRKRFLSLWLDSYDHRALQAAAEVVFGHQLPKRTSASGRSTDATLDPHNGRRTLIGFLETFLVDLEDVEEPDTDRGDDLHPRWRKLVTRSLMLVWLLDQASVAKFTDGCLFKSSSSRKSSTAVLQALATMLIPSIGDLTRVLRHLDYEVSHVQDPLDEVQYRINNIAIDLRNGILLTRLVEVLLFSRNQDPVVNAASDATVTIQMPDLTILESTLHDTSGMRSPRILAQHLKMPCIGRVQKVFNVEIALSALRDHGRTADGTDEVSAMDIVNGHREKTLGLLWSLVSVHGLDQLVDFDELAADTRRAFRSTVELPTDFTDLSQSDQESLLKKWASAHCAGRGLRIGNLTTAFADGKAYVAILDDFALFREGLSHRSSTSSGQSPLQQQLRGLGCSTAFINQLVANAGTIPSRKTTISNLAFLASRLLPLARRQNAATIIQRAFRHRQLKAIVSKHTALMRLAHACASVVQTHQRMTAAVTTLQRAWRRVVDTRIERLNNDVAGFQCIAKGWLGRRMFRLGGRAQSLRGVWVAGRLHDDQLVFDYRER